MLKKGKEYLIEKTQESVFAWYRSNYEAWFMSYPGYSMWTLAGYKSTTEGLLDNLEKVAQKNFDIPIRTVKDLCDIINRERLTVKR